MANTDGIIFSGSGNPGSYSSGGGTIFLWAGNSTDPAFLLQNISYSDLSDFLVASNLSVPLATAFYASRAVPVNTINTNNHFQNIVIDGTNGGLSYGFRWGADDAGQNGNNNDDTTNFDHVIVNNYTIAAWSLEWSQAKAILFNGCTFNSDGYGLYGVTTALAPSGGGSFQWYGGSGANSTEADFYIGPPNDPITISGFNGEDSNRFLETTSESAGIFAITIEGIRWSANNIDTDGKAIIYGYRGPLTLIGNMFQYLGVSGTVPVQIYVNTSGFGGAYNAFGNEIYSTLADPFTGSVRWNLVGNTINNGPPTVLPQIFSGPLLLNDYGAIRRPSPRVRLVHGLVPPDRGR